MRVALAPALAGSSLALAALTVLVGAGGTRAPDLDITVALQRVASPALDWLANLNTLIGQPPVSLALAAILALALWRRERGLAWTAAAFLLVPIVVGTLLKLAIVHPSPPEEFVRAFWNPLGVRVPTAGGFPSGHVARVTFLALLAGGIWRPSPVRMALGAVVLWTLWARVYIGDHWASDALGGLALGTFSGCVALLWLRRHGTSVATDLG